MSASTVPGYPRRAGRNALSRPDLAGGTVPRALDMVRLGEVLNDTTLSPPVQALVMIGVNPVVVVPNAELVRTGLMRDDLFTSGMRLEVMTLGQELVLRDGVPCTMRVRGSVAVLTYLALHPRSTRQTVITDLWPERDPKKAATYFRQES